MTGIDKNVQKVEKHMDELNTSQGRLAEQQKLVEEEKLLKKLRPPDGSLFSGKPACLEGTRISTLEYIHRWIAEEESTSQLFWLHGVAGCGKSSVATSICQALGDRLAGSFFCKRDQDERRDPVRLIWTLAFYLQMRNAPYRNALLSALQKPDVFVNKDLATQFALLIEKPLVASESYNATSTPIFVIDALDECGQVKSIVLCLVKLLESTPWVRLILTSRDIPEVRTTVMALSRRHIHDLFKDNARDDIRAYLAHELSAEGCLFDVSAFIEPYSEVLVEKSQGLFIWIRTVVTYITQKDFGKLEAVEEIVHAETTAGAEKALDGIYKAVLHNAAGNSRTGKQLVQYILGYILAASSIAPLTEDIIYAFLPSSLLVVRGEFMTVLRRLAAVLVEDKDSRTIKAFHSSLLDFIASKSRCGDGFFLPLSCLHAAMASGCFEIMEQGTRNRRRDPKARPGLHFNICELETSYLTNDEVENLNARIEENISSELQYSCIHWLDHIDHAQSRDPDFHIHINHNCTICSAQTHIADMVEDFLFLSLSLHWLESMSLMHALPHARAILLRLTRQRIVSNNVVRFGSIAYLYYQFSQIVLLLASEISSHLDRHFDAMTLSTPHVYTSAMAWIPSDSILWNGWSAEFSGVRILKQEVQYTSHLLRQIVVKGFVRSFDVSPDGVYIATGSYEGAVAVWDMQSARLLRSVRVNGNVEDDKRGSQNIISALAYSRDGQRIFFASTTTYNIEALDSKSLRSIHEPLQGHSRSIICLAISPVEPLLASGSGDNTICLWNVHTLSLIHKLEGHTGAVNSIAFYPDGIQLVSAAGDTTLSVWNGRSGSRIGEPLRGHAKAAIAVAVSEEGFIASGSNDKTVRVWDGTSLLPIGRPQERSDAVTDVDWVPGLRALLSSTRQGSVQAWFPFSNGTTEKDSFDMPYVARTLSFSPDGTRMVTSKANAVDVHVWDRKEFWRYCSYSARQSRNKAVRSVQFSNDSSQLLISRNDGQLRVQNDPSGKIISEIPLAEDAMFLAFSPTGKHYVISQTGNAQIIQTDGGDEPVIIPQEAPVRCATIGPDGTRIAISSGDSNLSIWDATSGSLTVADLECHESPVNAVAFSPDGSLLGGSSEDRTIRLWDASTGLTHGKPMTGSLKAIFSFAFSPQGNFIVAAGQDRVLRLWDVETQGSHGPALFGHKDVIYAATFSHDGRYVYSSSRDQTLRCWDVQSGSQVGRTLHAFTGFIYKLSASKDGTRIAGGFDDGTVRIWDSQCFFWDVDTSICENGLLGPERVPENVGEDGWLRTGDGRLLLRVPREYRTLICDMSARQAFEQERVTPIRVDWERFCHGERWTEVYRPKTRSQK